MQDGDLDVDSFTTKLEVPAGINVILSGHKPQDALDEVRRQ